MAQLAEVLGSMADPGCVVCSGYSLGALRSSTILCDCIEALATTRTLRVIPHEWDHEAPAKNGNGSGLRVVSNADPRLVFALQSGYFCRAKVELTLASNFGQLLDLAGWTCPDVVIVIPDSTSSEHDEAAPHLIRKSAGPRTRVFLARSSVREPIADALKVYDEVVSLDDPLADLLRLLGPLIVSPKRRHSRTRVQIPVRVLADGRPPIDGVTEDVSDVGACLVLPREPHGSEHTARFIGIAGQELSLEMRLLRTEPLRGGWMRVGVRFWGNNLLEWKSLWDGASPQDAG